MATNTIKLRAQEKGGVTTVKALITHPMETGQTKDSKTGELIPAHFIQEVSCTHGGNTVLSRRTVDVHVTALRRKLGDYGPLIETVRGEGYRFRG